MAEIFTGITVQGLYNDVSGDALYGVIGTTAPASAIFLAGKDTTTGFLQPFSVDSSGNLNVNASITPPSDNTATGTIAFASSTAVTVSTEGTSALMVNLLDTAGTYDGKVLFEVSFDGSTFEPISLYPAVPNGTPAVSSYTGTATIFNKTWTVPVGGIREFRVIGDGTTGTAGAVTVFLTAGQGQYSVFNYSDNQANFLTTAYQGGTWNVGVTGTVAVTQSTTPWAVAPDGTTWALTGTSANVDVTNTVTTTVSGTVDVNVTNASISVTQSTSPWVVSGTVTANAGTGTFTVAGNLTHNNAAPAADNIGALVAVASSAAPTYTAGDQVLLSTDLAGNLRVSVSGTTVVAGNKSNNAAAPTTDNLGVLPAVAQAGTLFVPTPATYTAGDQVLPLTSLGGSLAVIPADELYAKSLSYYSYDSGFTFKNTSGSAYTYLWSIQANSATIKFLLRSIQFFTDGSNNWFQLIKNGTLTGTSFAAGPGSVNVDTAGAWTTSTGTVVFSGYVNSTPLFYDALLTAMTTGATGDTFTVVAHGFGGGKAAAAIRWSEQSVSI